MVMPEQDLVKYRELIDEGLQGLASDPVWPRAQIEFATARQRGATIFLAGTGVVRRMPIIWPRISFME